MHFSNLIYRKDGLMKAFKSILFGFTYGVVVSGFAFFLILGGGQSAAGGGSSSLGE